MILSTPIPDLSEHSASFQGLDGSAINVGYTEHIRSSTGGGYPSNRRSGTLVTFVQATVGDLADATNEAFDEAIGAFGTVVKPTQSQNFRGSNVMNGNRYCVVDAGEKTIPGTIMVLNIQTQRKVAVHLRYKGHQWWCRRCDEYHVGVCEYLKKFHEALEIREEEMITAKIMSDSTLRLAESVGLRADVLCMSGGGVGHLANAVRDDPVMKERNEVFVVTGGNDYVRTEYADNVEYVFTIDKSLEKLQRVASATPDKAVKVLYVRDNPEEPALSPDLALKEHYFEQELVKLASPQIQVVPVPKSEVEMDDRGHPSEGGTLPNLKGINERMEDDLFLNTEFTTSKRLYAGVQGVYRFGCRTCDAKGGGGGEVPTTVGYLRPLHRREGCIQRGGEVGISSRLSVHAGEPAWGAPSPSGLGALPGGGYPAFAEGIQSCKRELETSMSQEPSMKRQVANTTPSSDDNSDGGK